MIELIYRFSIEQQFKDLKGRKLPEPWNNLKIETSDGQKIVIPETIIPKIQDHYDRLIKNLNK